MRTKIYLSIVLALAIQVMVNGQTQGTQHDSKLGAVVKFHSAETIKIRTTSDGRYVIPSTAKQELEAAMIQEIALLENEGSTNLETYTANKKSITDLLSKTSLSPSTGKDIRNLVSEAAINMRRGSEMRQEAYAMPSIGAKLGSLSNANEKEIIAIGEQNQAIHIVKTYIAAISIGINIQSYCVK
jgi:hypothetical protein